MGMHPGSRKVDFVAGWPQLKPMQALIPFPDISHEVFGFDIAGFRIALRWYALAYIAGILAGWRIGVMLTRRARLWLNESPPMQPGMVEEYMTWAILGIMLGGRLGFVLFYQPAYYLAHPGEILAIWQGGMSFHGGLLGVIIASYIFALRHALPKLSLADLIAACVAPGLFFGRIANFINAELWGRPTTMPWGVAFPGQTAQSCPPEFGTPCGRHPSQLYEAGLEGLVLGVLLLVLVFAFGWLKHPGRISAVFFIGYGVARFIVEYFRVADAHFITADNPAGHVLSLGAAGVTMGQLLSLPMILLGLILWYIGRRRA